MRTSVLYVSERLTIPIFANFNRLCKTKRERLKHFNILRESLENLLKESYSPYETKPLENEYSANTALDFALEYPS